MDYFTLTIKAIHQNDPGKTIAVIHRYTTKEMQQDGNLKSVLDREFDMVGIKSYGRRFNYHKKKKPIFFTNPFEIKGLEFDYVFIIHFDRDHYPSQERIQDLDRKHGGSKWGDINYEKDFDDIFNDEKKVLYVACSRAKQELYLYYVGGNFRRVSQFIRDFDTRDYECNFKKSVYKN